MTLEQLFKANDSLEDLVMGFASDNYIRQEISNLKFSNNIDSTDDLAKIIESKKNDDRLMNIGIVGRVKAGKSSLLNALFFDGKNILPSAATPMTAALTTLTYGESFQASVDFYNASDIANIATKHREYQELYDRKVNEQVQRYTDKRGEAPTGEQMEKIQQMVKRDIKDPTLSSAYDQYERMKASGLLHTTGDNQVIEASSMEQLAGLLLEYVGANGRYMPFTKSVNISLPIESLKDIRVIDTPGFNDPVQSREARTVELLHECDVIFIISSASQFLSAEDFDMLSRITTKEGIQEIYVIASQIDNSFHASEKRDTPSETLAVLTEKLASRIKDDIGAFQQAHPELGSTFNALIQNSQSNLLYSSGVAYGIAQKLAKHEELSENEKTPWENLKRSFPNHFSDEDIKTSIHSLNDIANIENIRSVLIDVRQKKDEIIQKNIESFVATKFKNLTSYRDGLLKIADQKMLELEQTDKTELEKQIEQYKELEVKVRTEMNSCYRNLIDYIKKQINDRMIRAVDEQLNSTQKAYENNTNSETKIETRNKSGVFYWLARKLWGGGTKTVEIEQTTIYGNHCTKALYDFMTQIDNALGKTSLSIKEDFDKKVYRDIMERYRQAVNNDDELIKARIARLAIEHTQNLFVVPEFSGMPEIPSQLKGKGKLVGDDADEFLGDLEDFTRNLHDSFRKEIRMYEERVGLALTQADQFGDQFARSFMEAYESLFEALNTINQSKYRLETFKADLVALELV